MSNPGSKVYRPGKYRIYKTFYRDTKEVTYVEFEIFSNLK